MAVITKGLGNKYNPFFTDFEMLRNLKRRTLNKESLQCACSYKSKCSDLYKQPDWLDEHNDGKEYQPSYNIAPTDVTPVLTSANNFKPNADEHDRVLKPMMWGIIPSWHKGDYRKHDLSTNNCRIETIKTSKLYGPALRDGGRCIVVVEGFYEWQTTKCDIKKQPYYIYSNQNKDIQMDEPDSWNNTFTQESGWKGVKMMYIAGLYNVWKNQNTVIYCYSVITMESNSTFDWLHHRVPAILDNEEQIQAWLDVKNVNCDMALNYLKPIKSLLWYPVSTDVNNSRNKSNSCNKIISLKNKLLNKQKTITAWFSKTSTKRKLDETSDEESKKAKLTV